MAQKAYGINDSIVGSQRSSFDEPDEDEVSNSAPVESFEPVPVNAVITDHVPGAPVLDGDVINKPVV